MKRLRIISTEEWKRKAVTEALGENGTDFTALANMVLDANRRQASMVASTAEREAYMEKRGLEYKKSPVQPVTWSAEEINGLADYCATKSETFNREEWLGYIGNKKKVWVVNFGLSGLPIHNEELTVIQRHVDSDEFGDDIFGFEHGVDYLVEAETPSHAEELVTDWFENWQLLRTKLASADAVTTYNVAKEAIAAVSK